MFFSFYDFYDLHLALESTQTVTSGECMNTKKCITKQWCEGISHLTDTDAPPFIALAGLKQEFKSFQLVCIIKENEKYIRVGTSNPDKLKSSVLGVKTVKYYSRVSFLLC